METGNRSRNPGGDQKSVSAKLIINENSLIFNSI